jgi:hypothetical protein
VGRTDRVRVELGERLRGRREEIEQAFLTRVEAIADPIAVSDPTYTTGLREAVVVALEYALAAIEQSGEPDTLPAPLLAQARAAARNGVDLATVLRRYFAGYTLLENALIEEARDGDLLCSDEVARILCDQATLFDRLLVSISEEYGREVCERAPSMAQRRMVCVERTLAGQLVDTSELNYDLSASHLGVVAVGPTAQHAIRDLAGRFDARLLLVHRDEDTVWAWLGARRALDPDKLSRCAKSALRGEASLALGEPAAGLAGWRLTHRQAASALSVALRSLEPCVRYGDVALLAAVLRDDLSARMLRDRYLTPLDDGPGGGRVLRQTLRAYIEAGRAVSSAAAAMGVKRHTVTKRLRSIEETIGRPIDGCTAELAVALRLEELVG